ncbi:hypothetical protein [Nocardioides panaciterrulae]|uniref:Putative membrane-anchored protein n=1 Tax=Nocardioides panaciterrulae TaxID=661492 RepID=A0A7Y9E9W8_9ACTN|nr:hypothetical protein [Nocardioides panaciterrulae]NYD43886.1 putative membrane-anchored protein [Nocardioides panaciterrulae]
MTMTTNDPRLTLRPGVTLNKVPEVIAIFWIIKVLATTVGETAADYLNETLGFGLTNTTAVMSVLFVVVLAVQFSLERYLAPVYWLTVVLISVVGTLITDNLTDGLGVPLIDSTIVFGLLLAATFTGWYAVERTLSIHSVVSRRREAFYWLAILFTFALGTATGDLIGEQFGLGYGTSLALFAGVIVLVAIAFYGFHINAVLAFWAVYVMTRPLGASIGDLLSQTKADGGLGIGTTATSFVFLAVILALVVYLTATKQDVQELHRHPHYDLDGEPEAA